MLKITKANKQPAPRGKCQQRQTLQNNILPLISSSQTLCRRQEASFFFKDVVLNVCLCLDVYATCMQMPAKWHVVVNYPTWVLGWYLASRRTARALNCWAISLAPYAIYSQIWKRVLPIEFAIQLNFEPEGEIHVLQDKLKQLMTSKLTMQQITEKNTVHSKGQCQ